jgi:hypothetical protein
MEHPMQVLRYLPNKYKSTNGGRPSGTEVLQAALQVEQIDDYTKAKIRAVLDLLPKLEEAQAAAPQSVKQAVDGLRQQLTNLSVEEQRSLLRDAGTRSRVREEGLIEGMEVAARMLEDGRDSIYSADHSFHKMLREERLSAKASAGDTVSVVSSADTIGATVGGAVGTAAAGVGAGPGAVAGGAAASAGAVIGAVLAWIF